MTITDCWNESEDEEGSGLRTAKSILFDVRSDITDINALNAQIEEIWLSQLPSGIRYDRDRVQTSPDDQMIKAAAKVEELAAELNEELEKLQIKRREAKRMIGRLKKANYRKVLRLYFLDIRLLTMQDVADEMHYTLRWTYKLYKKALKELEEVRDDTGRGSAAPE